MKKQLDSLCQQARRLAITGSPTTPVIVKVLSSLSQGDCHELATSASMNEHRITQIAKEINEPESTVRSTLYNCVCSITKPLTQYYKRQQDYYLQANFSDSEIRAFLSWCSEAPQFVFLLGTEINTWIPMTRQLQEVLLRPEDEADPFPAALEGFLVAQGKAFPIDMDLLEVSRNEGWPGWQDLWTWF
jgi:hypothetical protein